MRYDLTFKPVHTFEYWRPIISYDADGNDSVSFEYEGDKKGLLVGLAAGIAQLFTTDQMEIDTEVRDLRDAKGQSVFTTIAGGEQYIMFVASADPIFDPTGKLMGWKHGLRRSGGVLE